MGKVYYSKLDSLRFIAFLLVFWQHAFENSFNSVTVLPDWIIESITRTGSSGVHIFFVLSGFLITLLLLKEFAKNKKISLGSFYLRRVFRIWPLYYLVVILGVFILPYFFNTFTYCGNNYLNLLFLNNFNIDFSCQTSNIIVVWSVAIEEQFYLIWPLVFMIGAKKPILLAIACFALYVFSAIFIIQNPSTSYFHTFGNIGYLMVGCFGALLYHNSIKSFNKGMLFNKVSFLIALLFCVLLQFFKPYGYFLITPFFYLYMVLYCVITEQFKKRQSWFSQFGKYTYGMYLYHLIIVMGAQMVFDKMDWDFRNEALTNNLMGIITLIITIFISVYSYKFLETPFLRLKAKFSKI